MAVDMSFAEGVVDVPNLDGLDTRSEAYRAASEVYARMAAYCILKAKAMEFRLAGDIDAALSYERSMEKAYQAFPDWAQW